MGSSAPSARVGLEPAGRERGFPTARPVSRQIQWRFFVLTLIGTDVFAAVLAFGLAYIVRFKLSIPVFQQGANSSVSYYVQLVVILLPIWVIVFSGVGLYSRANLLGGTKEYALLFRATTIGLLLVIVVGFLEHVFIFSRGWLLMAWVSAFVFSAFGRFLLRRLVYRLRELGYFLAPALIVGANEEARSMAEQLPTWRTSGLQVLGYVDSAIESSASFVSGLARLGTMEDLDQLIKKYEVEELILATSALSRRQMLEIFKNYGVSEDVSLRLSSGLFEIITTGLTVEELAYVPLIRVNKLRLTGIDKGLKSVLDYGLTILGLILIFPLFMLIAIAIKLDSPGRIVYRRRVMGVNGGQFDAFKFRTMYANSDEILAAHAELQAELAAKHKIKEDPRVTRIGRFLRQYSLDELPQLINVLRNEMSLVGPRMISPEELPKYNQWGINLLTVTPGITGIWQVSGRSDLTYAERVQLDMQYVRNWTIWLDLQLLFQTIPAVISRRGAY